MSRLLTLAPLVSSKFAQSTESSSAARWSGVMYSCGRVVVVVVVVVVCVHMRAGHDVRAACASCSPSRRRTRALLSASVFFPSSTGAHTVFTLCCRTLQPLPVR